MQKDDIKPAAVCLLTMGREEDARQLVSLWKKLEWWALGPVMHRLLALDEAKNPEQSEWLRETFGEIPTAEDVAKSAMEYLNADLAACANAALLANKVCQVREVLENKKRSVALRLDGAAANDVPTSDKTKKVSAKSLGTELVMRFDEWAIGFDEGKQWILFRRFGRNWRDQKRVAISTGRQYRLLMGFYEGKGYLSKKDILRREEIPEQSRAAAKKLLRKIPQS